MRLALQPASEAGSATDSLRYSAFFAGRELWMAGRLSPAAWLLLSALDACVPRQGGVFALGDRKLEALSHVARENFGTLCQQLQDALGRRRFSAVRREKCRTLYWLRQERETGPSDGPERTTNISVAHETGQSGAQLARFMGQSGPLNGPRFNHRRRHVPWGSPQTPLPEDGSPHPLRGSPPSPGGIPDVEPQAPQPCAKEECPSQVAAIREQIWRQFGDRAPVKGAASPGLRMSWGLRPVGAVLAQNIGQGEGPDKSQSDS